MNFKPASHYVISISMEGEGANPKGEFWVDDITVEPIEYNILIGIEVIAWKQEIFEDQIDVIVGLDIINSVFANGDYLDLKIYI